MNSSDDDSIFLQMPQTLGQESPRHQRHTAMNVIEAVCAQHQLAQHERRPARGEDLGRLCYRAELTVAAFHGREFTHVWVAGTSPDSGLVAVPHSANDAVLSGWNPPQSGNLWREPCIAMQVFRAGKPWQRSAVRQFAPSQFQAP